MSIKFFYTVFESCSHIVVRINKHKRVGCINETDSQLDDSQGFRMTGDNLYCASWEHLYSHTTFRFKKGNSDTA
jgi:hypothetical protein